MHIGQLSEFSGYSQRMLRYLEDQGLIHPLRGDSNFRQFKDADLTRVLKIKRLKDLGFTYVEIKDLIDMNDQTIAQRGTELLRRHHDDAKDLLDKIHQLEKMCFGEYKTQKFPQKMTTNSFPNRTAYRIEKLNLISIELSKLIPGARSSFSLWKFGGFLDSLSSLDSQELEIFEIFKGASIMAVFEECEFFSSYLSAWQNQFFPLDTASVGKFKKRELTEFFSKFEIVIDHTVADQNGKILISTLLPYQAVFLASGQSKLG